MQNLVRLSPVLSHLKKKDMRQIKFRAWDIDSSEMLTDFNSRHSDFYLDFDKCVMRLMMCVEYDYPEVREANIMQFTGLFDKEGREIWEGDIMKFLDENWLVIYFEQYASFMLQKGNDLANITTQEEKIGNIYANPDLLK